MEQLTTSASHLVNLDGVNMGNVGNIRCIFI